MDMMPEEAIVSATINAAYAINKAEFLGSLDIGKQADFIILKENSYLFIPYHYGVNPIWQTYKKGKKVFDAFAADC
jgi:imidazolonepropionase